MKKKISIIILSILAFNSLSLSFSPLITVLASQQEETKYMSDYKMKELAEEIQRMVVFDFISQEMVEIEIDEQSITLALGGLTAWLVKTYIAHKTAIVVTTNIGLGSAIATNVYNILRNHVFHVDNRVLDSQVNSFLNTRTEAQLEDLTHLYHIATSQFGMLSINYQDLHRLDIPTLALAVAPSITISSVDYSFIYGLDSFMPMFRDILAYQYFASPNATNNIINTLLSSPRLEEYTYFNIFEWGGIFRYNWNDFYFDANWAQHWNRTPLTGFSISNSVAFSTYPLADSVQPSIVALSGEVQVGFGPDFGPPVFRQTPRYLIEGYSLTIGHTWPSDFRTRPHLASTGIGGGASNLVWNGVFFDTYDMRIPVGRFHTVSNTAQQVNLDQIGLVFELAAVHTIPIDLTATSNGITSDTIHPAVAIPTTTIPTGVFIQDITAPIPTTLDVTAPLFYAPDTVFEGGGATTYNPPAIPFPDPDFGFLQRQINNISLLLSALTFEHLYWRDRLMARTDVLDMGLADVNERTGALENTITDVEARVRALEYEQTLTNQGISALPLTLIGDFSALNFNSWLRIGGLTDVFPFSLPWDILHLISVLNVPTETPYITLDFSGTVFENVDLTVLDLGEFSVIFDTIRFLIGLIFSIGLVVLSMNVFK